MTLTNALDLSNYGDWHENWYFLLSSPCKMHYNQLCDKKFDHRHGESTKLTQKRFRGQSN